MILSENNPNPSLDKDSWELDLSWAKLEKLVLFIIIELEIVPPEVPPEDINVLLLIILVWLDDGPELIKVLVIKLFISCELTSINSLTTLAIWSIIGPEIVDAVICCVLILLQLRVPLTSRSESSKLLLNNSVISLL